MSFICPFGITSYHYWYIKYNKICFLELFMKHLQVLFLTTANFLKKRFENDTLFRSIASLSTYLTNSKQWWICLIFLVMHYCPVTFHKATSFSLRKNRDVSIFSLYVYHVPKRGMLATGAEYIIWLRYYN